MINPEDIMDKERFWKDELSQVNEKYLFGGGSKQDAAKGVVGSHAYAVLEAWEVSVKKNANWSPALDSSASMG